MLAAGRERVRVGHAGERDLSGDDVVDAYVAVDEESDRRYYPISLRSYSFRQSSCVRCTFLPERPDWLVPTTLRTHFEP